jgi:chromate transporter
MDWLLFFWLVLKSVLFSTGGFGPLPSLHDDLIAKRWASEQQFTQALTIGQVTPGPSGLWVVSLCYLVGGLNGALLGCVALLLPPLLVVIVQRCHARIAHLPATKGLLDGVVLVIVSFSMIVLGELFLNNGLDGYMLAIALISATLAISRRVSVNVILMFAALAGLLLA